jgi:hypothetical protein
MSAGDTGGVAFSAGNERAATKICNSRVFSPKNCNACLFHDQKFESSNCTKINTFTL